MVCIPWEPCRFHVGVRKGLGSGILVEVPGEVRPGTWMAMWKRRVGQRVGGAQFHSSPRWREGDRSPISCSLGSCPSQRSVNGIWSCLSAPSTCSSLWKLQLRSKKDETELDGLNDWCALVFWSPCICRIPHGCLWAINPAPLMCSGLQ